MSEHKPLAHWAPAARYVQEFNLEHNLDIFMVLQFGIYTWYCGSPWSVRRCGSVRLKARQIIVILPTNGTQLLFVGLSVRIGAQMLDPGREVRQVSALVRVWAGL